jgi:hypothetical protein
LSFMSFWIGGRNEAFVIPQRNILTINKIDWQLIFLLYLNTNLSQANLNFMMKSYSHMFE